MLGTNAALTAGHSYKDPLYDRLEADLEKKHGLPAGIMRSIRVKGERSNADQVSEAGARSVYQIIPGTRDAFKKKYGVDAYGSTRGAAEVAALHLKESFQRGADWNRAVAEYHGGTDTRNWGVRTKAYVARAGNGRGNPVAGDGYSAPAETPVPNLDYSGDWLNMRPADASKREMPKHVNSHTAEADRLDRLMAVTGRTSLFNSYASDPTPQQHEEVKGREADDVAETTRQANITMREKGRAAFDDLAGIVSIFDALEAAHPEYEDGYGAFYMSNIDKIEGDAQNEWELSVLRETTSEISLKQARARIERKRQNLDRFAGSGTSPIATLGYSVVASLLDPVGWAAGLGVGKLFQLGGVGARVMFQARRPLAGVASMAAEGAIGNVAVTAMIDQAGDTILTSDYAAAAFYGASIGLAASPFVGYANRPDSTALAAFAGATESSRKATADLLDRAEANLGPTATQGEVIAEAARLDVTDQHSVLQTSLADVPDEYKVLTDSTGLLTSNEAVRMDVEHRHGLDGLSDDAERKAITEVVARMERLDNAEPINADALNPATIWIGQQSTGVDLLRSSSVVARGLGRILTESTTGAAGRRRTAAMAQAVRERLYNAELDQFSSLYHLFRKEQGRSIMREAWDGKAYKEFERRVFMELEARADTKPGTSIDAHPAVRRAADLLERGFDKMRVEQQYVDAIGSARLGTTSRGYVPHKLLGAKVLKLTDAQQRKLRDILSRQFQGEENGFDKDFADKLAKKYLEQAKRRAMGGYDVPMNLHTSEAADIVRDSLEAMKLPAEEIEKLMGKYSRGGASHTKKRLRLNLNEDIDQGLKLADLYDTSVTGLYRGYARRVSGEVALAQYGIMGKKGLMLARTAIESTGGDAPTLRAFDQIAAEFLNTPFGGAWNHKYMDNIRIATSLSRLGGMGFTQLGEYGNGIAALGVARTFSAIGSMPRLFGEIKAIRAGRATPNPILHSIDLLGGDIGLDEYNMTRLFDVRDNDIQVYGTEQLGFGTRLLRAGGNVQAMLSGHRMIVGVQTRGMAEQIVRKAIQYARDGVEDKALDDMGITAPLREALRKDMEAIATFKGGKLESLDLSKGTMSGHRLMELRDAIERGASQIIQRTYTGETGKWAHNGFLKLLFQFRTFSLTAVEKQWGRNRANHGSLKSFMYLMGAMSFAAPIHMARVQSKMVGMSDKEAEEYAEKNLSMQAIARATINYASSAGLAGDILDVGVGFAAAAGGEELGTSLGARQGRGRSNLVGGVAAPGVGLLQDVWDGTHGDGEKLFRALPFANLPYLQPAVSAVRDDD